MGQSELVIDIANEAALSELAGRVAVGWRASNPGGSLSVGLSGELGAGKTAWVRAILRGLGFSGRVPSPTYTLMEIYEVAPITLIHMDLYRINGDEELAQLGIRDWQERPGCWVLAEWPQRAPGWFARCDVLIRIEIQEAQTRRIHCSARTRAAERWLAPFKVT